MLFVMWRHRCRHGLTFNITDPKEEELHNSAPKQRNHFESKVRKANHTLTVKKNLCSLNSAAINILHLSCFFQLNEIQTTSQFSTDSRKMSEEELSLSAAIVLWCTWEQQCAGFPQLVMSQESHQPLKRFLHCYFSGLSARVLCRGSACIPADHPSNAHPKFRERDVRVNSS